MTTELMEDAPVKSLKSAARRGGIVSAAALSALALASCSAGQVTQTSTQVAAVDGAWADSEGGEVAVRDVTVLVLDDNSAALKFTAVNQDPTMTAHTLESVQVDGTEVELENTPALGHDCSLVGDSEEGLEGIPETEIGCIEYTATSLDNEDFPIAGSIPVTFSFDTGTIEVTAPISAPTPTEAGTINRQSGEGRVYGEDH